MTPLQADNRTRFLHTSTATTQPEHPTNPEITNYFCDCDRPAIRIGRNLFWCNLCREVLRVHLTGCVYLPEEDFQREIAKIYPNII